MKNDKGLTLIEVLAAITILGVILISFFSLFSQSMMFSSKVEDRLSAINIAERILYEVDQNVSLEQLEELTQPCTKPTSDVATDNEIGLSIDDSGYFYEINNKKYYVTITICQTPDEEKLQLYRVHVKMSDNQMNDSLELTELYDYINGREK